MAEIGVTGTAGHLDIKQRKAANLRLYTNDLERFTILSSGNVGIGTTAPGSEVDIEGSHTATNTGAPYGANSTHINIKNT